MREQPFTPDPALGAEPASEPSRPAKNRSKPIEIAIVGGGPSGLMTARNLEALGSDRLRVTLLEASDRLGGKVLTRSFTHAPIPYEAGAAEFYDYSHLGVDPLRDLVADLGLSSVPMRGSTVILGDDILRGEGDLLERYGWPTFAAVGSFQQRCVSLYPPADYYESYTEVDAAHPWASLTFREVLDGIKDATARRYIEAAVRSDTATEPERTSALNGLKNVLMDDPRYMRLYSVRGGNESLTRALASSLTITQIRRGTRVTAIGRSSANAYTLAVRQDGRDQDLCFEVVILALPHDQLRRLDFSDRRLRSEMRSFVAHYDHPAHYLRLTALFPRPFWRRQLKGSYFLSDAFGGCCIYDEGARHSCAPYGVLSWLIAGRDAADWAGRSDGEILAAALSSLPAAVSRRPEPIEAHVHRWVNSVSALPGGWRVQGLRERHQPAPNSHPGLFVVGDYLFDSTLNAAMDSADCVSTFVVDWLARSGSVTALKRPALRRAEKFPKPRSDGVLEDAYFDHYDGENDYAQAIDEFFSESYVLGLIRTVWGAAPPYRLLDCGSANGLTLARFARRKVDAWGIENSAYIHARTPAAWRDRNLLGDVRALPFPDDHFDFVYETCLCYVPPEDIDRALQELFRVSRRGVLFGSITTDMSREVIDAYGLLQSVRTPLTLWEWSERFARAGFRLATADERVLERAWKIELKENAGAVPWYADAESLRYCFYSKPAPLAPALSDDLQLRAEPARERSRNR